jgi:hypothetical protein
MHYFILLTVSQLADLCGVTGHSQWNAIATASSLQSEIGGHPMPPLIGTFWKMHSSHRSRLSMIWQMNLLCSLVGETCPWEHTRVLAVSPAVSFISQSRSDFPIEDPTCMLLRPCVIVQQGTGSTSLSTGLLKSITTALSTRFGLHISTIRKHLQEARIEEWGKVQRIDSDAGDIIHSSGLTKPTADHWDATFVRVSCTLLDLWPALMIGMISM